METGTPLQLEAIGRRSQRPIPVVVLNVDPFRVLQAAEHALEAVYDG